MSAQSNGGPSDLLEPIEHVLHDQTHTHQSTTTMECCDLDCWTPDGRVLADKDTFGSHRGRGDAGQSIQPLQHRTAETG
jgi:hypothetical protein